MVYAVTLLGRFSSDPSNFHWNAIKHLLRYVKATLDTKLPLIHSLPGKEFLVGFADGPMLTMLAMRLQASRQVAS